MAGDHRGPDSEEPVGQEPAAPQHLGAEQPFLHRPQGILMVVSGVVTTIAAVVGLVFLLVPDAQPEPAPPELELVDYDLDKEKNIQADGLGPDGEATGAVEGWKASLVTIMLRNSSDNPVLVRQATFRFSSKTQLGCPYGAGGSKIKARYDIKIPNMAKAPFSVSRKMKYTVPPHKQERVAFTFGPESVHEGSLPTVYTFTTTLHLDDGSRIEVPEMTYLESSKTEIVLGAAEQAVEAGGQYAFTTVACVKAQERKARQILKGSKRSSPELKHYSSELTRIVG